MNTKRIVIVMGSPRISGNSATLAHETAEGARASGAEWRVSTFMKWTLSHALLAMYAGKALWQIVISMMARKIYIQNCVKHCGIKAPGIMLR